MPYDLSFVIRRSWGTESNALRKSRYNASTGSPSSIVFVQASRTSSSWVIQERLALKPCWSLESWLVDNRWSMSWSLTSDSRTLHGTEVKLTGRWLLGSRLSPSWIWESLFQPSNLRGGCHRAKISWRYWLVDRKLLQPSYVGSGDGHHLDQAMLQSLKFQAWSAPYPQWWQWCPVGYHVIT